MQVRTCRTIITINKCKHVRPLYSILPLNTRTILTAGRKKSTSSRFVTACFISWLVRGVSAFLSSSSCVSLSLSSWLCVSISVRNSPCVSLSLSSLILEYFVVYLNVFSAGSC